MKSIFLLLFSVLLLCTNANSQITELFEDESVGSSSFTVGGVTFDITSAEGFDVFNFSNGGWNGTAPDNQFVDNSGGTTNNTGTNFTLKQSDNGGFSVTYLFLFCSTAALSNHSGTLTITGKLNGGNVYSFTKSSGFSNPSTFTPNNGFTYINFATEGATDYSSTPIDELFISSTGNLDYMALDAFQFELQTLPVNLISFKGQIKETTVKLIWETVQEINNEKFEIEVSQNGREFQKIGEVVGKGTTSELQNYSFENEHPRKGISYYRLKQIDFDGQFKYSKVISMNFQNGNNRIGEIYPNPSKSGFLNLNYSSEFGAELTITVFDLSGKYLFNQTNQVLSGENNLIYDLSDLKTGIYIIKIGDKEKSTHQKIIIEK